MDCPPLSLLVFPVATVVVAVPTVAKAFSASNFEPIVTVTLVCRCLSETRHSDLERRRPLLALYHLTLDYADAIHGDVS